MKKFLIIPLLMYILFNPVFAEEILNDEMESFYHEPEVQELHGFIEFTESENDEDVIYLENSDSVKKINLMTPQKVSASSTRAEKEKATFYPFNDEIENSSKFSSQEYLISPINASYAGKIGKFAFGTKYNSFLDSAEMNYSTGLFSKYEGNHFALTMGFSKSTGNNYSSYKDRFYIAPEIKLSKRLSLVDIMQSNLDQIEKKNELVLRYTPNFRKYTDEIQFELGAGQTFYNEDYIKSSLRFSTRFKL